MDVENFKQRRVTLPRIVSAAVKKNSIPTVDPKDSPIIVKPYVAGELEMVTDHQSNTSKNRRYAEIREGCLLLYKLEDERKVFDFRILLRNLNLKIDPNCLDRFSLAKRGDVTPVATFQVPEGQDSCRWLKNLAMQIIINTPLNAVKFLDVLDIVEEYKKRQLMQQRRYQTRNNDLLRMKARLQDRAQIRREDDSRSRKIEFTSNRSKLSQQQQQQHEEEQPDLTRYLTAEKHIASNIQSGKQQQVLLPDVVSATLTSIPRYECSSPPISLPTTVASDYFRNADDVGNDHHVSIKQHRDYRDSREHLLADLLTRCQTNDRYVSVSEKRVLFESLSRFSYSVDNLIRRNSNNERRCDIVSPKYHSLHDLNNVNTVTSVKDMCRYFEKPSSLHNSWMIPEQTA